MPNREGRSAASRVFFALLLVFVVLAALIAGVMFFDGVSHARGEAAHVTRAVSETLAHSPEVARGLAASDPVAELQPLARDVMDSAGVDFVTIMTVDGTRVTHFDPERIGDRYLGTIPTDASTFTEEFTGTLGPSIRTITPVFGVGGQVGWVSVGVTIDTVTAALSQH